MGRRNIMKKTICIFIAVIFAVPILSARQPCHPSPPPPPPRHHHHHHCDNDLRTAAQVIGLVGVSIGLANALSTPKQQTVVQPVIVPVKNSSTVPTAPAPLPPSPTLSPTVINVGPTAASPKTIVIRPDGTRIENY